MSLRCPGATSRSRRCEGTRASSQARTRVSGDGPIPIGAETKALLCVVNAVGVRVKVQLVAKEADDVFSVRTSPSVVTLSKEKACLLRTHGDAELQHP